MSFCINICLCDYQSEQGTRYGTFQPHRRLPHAPANFVPTPNSNHCLDSINNVFACPVIVYKWDHAEYRFLCLDSCTHQYVLFHVVACNSGLLCFIAVQISWMTMQQFIHSIISRRLGCFLFCECYE